MLLMSFNAQKSPTTKDYPALNVTGARVESMAI